MQFHVERLDDPSCGAKCPQVFVADGVIEPDTPLAFVEFARGAVITPGVRGVVLINSPGGNVLASMELGAEFRKLGECVSACVYALMGAVRRVAPSISRIALHRMSVMQRDGFFGPESRRLADTDLVQLVARYAQRMGVDPAVVLTAESQSPDNIHVLSPREMRRWRLATSKF